ncbi:DUF3515 domain-containing protein [Pseudactinotalea sp.]|uniref:DUF3515 domain-containing protein n=1 Tax=Pseudactinotalea sp. TaxID=1926260 RepID=UPI003B3BAC4D
MAGSRWQACRIAGAVGVLAAASACSTAVAVDPAPSASEPVCAVLLLDLPNELGGQERRSTTSQASRAWGDPAIVLRCGVTPLPPTTDGCVTVAAEGGSEVDWVVTEDAENATFTTYGRVPAVEVTIPADYAGDQTIMTELSAVVVDLPQDGDRECL